MVFDCVTGTFGATIVTTRAENIVAGHAALDLLARHAAGYDAAILAISFDTALEAARDMAGIGVVGITGSAIRAARKIGPVGVIVFGALSLPLYEDVFHAQRLTADIAAIEVIDIGNAGAYLAPNAQDEAVAAACQRLKAKGARAVVICGAAIVGIARRIGSAVPLPLFDGAEPAVRAALASVGAGGARARASGLAGSVGLSAPLARALRGLTATDEDTL